MQPQYRRRENECSGPHILKNKIAAECVQNKLPGKKFGQIGTIGQIGCYPGAPGQAYRDKVPEPEQCMHDLLRNTKQRNVRIQYLDDAHSRYRQNPTLLQSHTSQRKVHASNSLYTVCFECCLRDLVLYTIWVACRQDCQDATTQPSHIPNDLSTRQALAGIDDKSTLCWHA